MGFFSSLFSRSVPVGKVAPSGELPPAALLSIAQGLCYNARASHGVDWTVTPIANTNSMLPLMDANTIVVLELVPFASLRTGDLVTYRGTRQTVLHRLGEKDARGHFVTAGLNNSVNDAVRVSPENFQRRVCGMFYGAKDATTDT